MSERRNLIPKEIEVHSAFVDRYKAVTANVRTLGSDYYPYLRPFTAAMNNNGLVVVPSTNRYDQDLKATASLQPPYGLELNTLSHNAKLVLSPKMTYEITQLDAARLTVKGIRPRMSGPQASLYLLDGFKDEEITAEAMTANIAFIGSMSEALLKGKYPLQKDHRSLEFEEQVVNAFKAVNKYLKGLTEGQKAKISPYIINIGELDEAEINNFVIKFIDYQVELTKEFGLIERDSLLRRQEDPVETAQAAVVLGTEYLHCSDRNFPPIIADQDIPALPWREYGRNRWNRDHQLFGRYEVADAKLKVDFRLDSTHFPAKYHFFDTVEMVQETEAGRLHIIFGQEVDKNREVEAELKAYKDPTHLDQLFHKAGFVFPIVLAGSFNNFEQARPYLEILANDKGTKPDVSVVLGDFLDLSSQGKLWNLESYPRRN